MLLFQIPVYLSKTLLDKLYVLQYPVRPRSHTYDESTILKVSTHTLTDAMEPFCPLAKYLDSVRDYIMKYLLVIFMYIFSRFIIHNYFYHKHLRRFIIVSTLCEYATEFFSIGDY